jgi:von Willebrand factor type A domain
MVLFSNGLLLVVSQTQPNSQKRNQRQTPIPKPQPSPEPEPAVNPKEPQDVETVKINTDLVMVPVIASDLTGIYVPDMQRNEFSIEEDGVPQEIAFFATVSAPFHVVLMLDTSGSTEEKLGLIRKAAITFTEQLQSSDRVKVISFDDEVRELNEFTSDKTVLKAAINKTRPGKGTRLYDAMDLALSIARPIQGRKAIVMFTDGVDFYSEQASFDSTVRGLDEEGVIVYPIRYETRAETERIARTQSEEMTPELPTIGVIRRPPSGTTAPTFPGEGPESVPTSGSRTKTGPMGLPSPSEILRPRPEIDPNRLPSPDSLPPSGVPDRRRAPEPRGTRTTRVPDSITAMLDALYAKADSYLKSLAEKSGGRVLRADTLVSLPDAFSQIAAELRTQYSLGYYPTNKNHDDTYRKIRIKTTRKNVVVRSRPGYQSVR